MTTPVELTDDELELVQRLVQARVEDVRFHLGIWNEPAKDGGQKKLALAERLQAKVGKPTYQAVNGRL